MNSAVIISHHPCLDGFAAATIMRQWLVSKAVAPEDIKWYPGVYGKPPPEVTKDDQVFVLDFSYPPEVMVDLADKSKELLWIDHHISSIEAWEQSRFVAPDNMYAVLSRDNSSSGALLTWEYCFGLTAPAVVRAIDDRDRWQFKFIDTKDICAYGFSLPDGEFGAMWEFLCSEDTKRVAEHGSALTAAQTKNCEALVEQAAAFTGSFLGLDIAAMNCPYFMASECAHIMLARYKADMAVCWFVDKEGVARFSLRSRSDSDIDVAKVAKTLGGGGHKNAAGFSLPFQHAVKTLPFINRY